jgi:hypothetical protein
MITAKGAKLRPPLVINLGQSIQKAPDNYRRQ